MNHIIELFDCYGYWVLLISLTLELVAFPLPGEALMTYCGYTIYMNKMSWPISIIVATTGAITGITISYFIGKMLGIAFFEKYGNYMHLSKKRVDKVSKWFQSYGNKLLIMAYFIPGVRHVTGYFSGITKVSYTRFAFSAYSGALLWAFTFITLGKSLGSNWEVYYKLLKKYLVILCLIVAIIVTIVYFYRKCNQKIQEWTIITLKNNINEFHSLGKINFLITGISATFLVFSAFAIGIIQDNLANEFSKFDQIFNYLITHTFNNDWENFMRIFHIMSSNYVIGSLWCII